MLLRYSVLICMAALALPGVSSAQSTMLASTFALRASGGIGWIGPAAEASIDRRTGPTVSVGLEHAFTSYLRGRAEITRWQSAALPSSSATFCMASAELFPLDGADAYVRTGVGYGGGSLYAPDVAVDGGTYSVAGPAFEVGVGYDYHTGGALTLGTFVTGANTIGGTAKRKVRSGTGEAVLISTGIALSWRL
jgi:hypothetical protein